MPDIASASDRMAPTFNRRIARLAYGAGAGAATRILPDPPATSQAGNPPRYISILSTVAVANGAHVVFGDVNVAAPTTDDPLFSIEVGYQDMIVPLGCTHVRVFGDGAGGTLYFWNSGL